MKKPYETPSAEKIAFNYRDQVVAASGGITEQKKDDLSSVALGFGCDNEVIQKVDKFMEGGFDWVVCNWNP